MGAGGFWAWGSSQRIKVGRGILRRLKVVMEGRYGIVFDPDPVAE